MAAQSSDLDLPVLVVVAEDSLTMVASEEETRRGLSVSGCGHYDHSYYGVYCSRIS